MNDRALPPGITLKDPRPVQQEAPYTFELPHPDHVAAMEVGDLVIFIKTVGELGTAKSIRDTYVSRQHVINANRNGYNIATSDQMV